MNESLFRFLREIPGFLGVRAWWGAAKAGATRFLWAPPGHFYSPLPAHEDVERALAGVVGDTVPEVDGENERQLRWWRRLTPHFSRMQFAADAHSGARFNFNNPYFPHGDAEVLFATLCELRPRTVVEVGSGYSSALMLDANDRELEGQTAFTFVEPFPKRLHGLLRAGDRTRTKILECPIQAVPFEVFEQLATNDILFVDSSHVAKAGSDVLHLLFRIWPKLQSGVVVHIHDIFWPFEYPADWFAEGRAWNESYFVRAFLAGNRSAEVLFMNSWFEAKHPEECAAVLPKAARTSSLWLRKKG